MRYTLGRYLRNKLWGRVRHRNSQCLNPKGVLSFFTSQISKPEREERRHVTPEKQQLESRCYKWEISFPFIEENFVWCSSHKVMLTTVQTNMPSPSALEVNLSLSGNVLYLAWAVCCQGTWHPGTQHGMGSRVKNKVRHSKTCEELIKLYFMSENSPKPSINY